MSVMNKTQKIVLMGGSFNPPTLAHYRLMKTAIDSLDANIGYFVPVSDAYLRRKMRHSHPPVVLSPELRLKMLRAMCTDSRMMVCEKEIGTIAARTVPTLRELQREHPDAELFFVMGADKLKLLAHLAEKKNFLDEFNVILFSRENMTIEEALRDFEILSSYENRIIALPQPDRIDTISSSIIRELMLQGKSSEKLMCPEVWELFREFTPADFPDVIDQFKDEYSFLRNQFSCRFVWQGITYNNAEAAFQSSKCADVSEREKYSRLSARKAARWGGEQIPFSGWEDARLDIMEEILKAKFEQNPHLMKELTDTGNRILINGDSNKDTFWGIDLYSWQGENNLGKILMSIRDKHKDEIQY